MRPAPNSQPQARRTRLTAVLEIDSGTVRLKIPNQTGSKSRKRSRPYRSLGLSVLAADPSSAYTYSNVRYETNYIGADDKSILVNQGSIPESFSPGDEHNSQIRDALYPNGTAWYKFKIVDAKSSVR